MNARNWDERGRRRLEENLQNQAIHAYRQGLRLSPRSSGLHLGLARASARKGLLMLAAGLYCRAAQLDPDDLGPAPENPTLTGDSQPVLVVGCPHSGTTLLTRMLGAHPSLRLAAERETAIFTRPPAEIQVSLANWDRDCPTGQRWVEKSVIHSFYLDAIFRHRPRARVVLMLRDGRDVVASLKQRTYCYREVGELVRAWVGYNAAVDGFPVWTVGYEALVSEPQATLTALCSFLDLDFSPAMLAFHETPLVWGGQVTGERSAFRRMRSEQVNQPLYDGRHRWRSELTPEDRALFEGPGQTWLERLGYVQGPGW